MPGKMEQIRNTHRVHKGAGSAGVAWAAKLPAQLLKVYAGAGQAEPPTSAAPSTPAPARGWQI